MRLGRLALPWLLGAWLLLPCTAFAQDRLARTHYDAGSSYYQQGRYEDALREFEEAYRLSSETRKPALLYNIGLAHERLGHLTEAIGSLQRYLEASPHADDAEIVTERIHTLQERLDSTGIALEVSEGGASVIVDGDNRGTTPLAEPLRVPPGAHEVRLEKAHFHALTIRVTVPAGERVSVQANLVPETAPPPPVQVVEPAAPARAQPSSGAGPLPWILFGVAGAAAIGGGVMSIVALDRRDAANEEATGDRRAYDDAREAAKATALLADVAFGVTIAAAGVAVVLLLTSGGSEDSEEPSAEEARGPVLTPVVLRGGVGLTLGGSL